MRIGRVEITVKVFDSSERDAASMEWVSNTYFPAVDAGEVEISQIAKWMLDAMTPGIEKWKSLED